jgi:hypothetical protein
MRATVSNSAGVVVEHAKTRTHRTRSIVIRVQNRPDYTCNPQDTTLHAASDHHTPHLLAEMRSMRVRTPFKLADRRASARDASTSQSSDPDLDVIVFFGLLASRVRDPTLRKTRRPGVLSTGSYSAPAQPGSEERRGRHSRGARAPISDSDSAARTHVGDKNVSARSIVVALDRRAKTRASERREGAASNIRRGASCLDRDNNPLPRCARCPLAAFQHGASTAMGQNKTAVHRGRNGRARGGWKRGRRAR